jgi:hypothetical protein
VWSYVFVVPCLHIKSIAPAFNLDLWCYQHGHSLPFFTNLKTGSLTSHPSTFGQSILHFARSLTHNEWHQLHEYGFISLDLFWICIVYDQPHFVILEQGTSFERECEQSNIQESSAQFAVAVDLCFKLNHNCVYLPSKGRDGTIRFPSSLYQSHVPMAENKI